MNKCQHDPKTVRKVITLNGDRYYISWTNCRLCKRQLNKTTKELR